MVALVSQNSSLFTLLFWSLKFVDQCDRNAKTPSILGRLWYWRKGENRGCWRVPSSPTLVSTQTGPLSPAQDLPELSNNCHNYYLNDCSDWGMPDTWSLFSSSIGTDISPTIGLLWNQEIAAQIVHKFISVPPYSIYYKNWSAKDYGLSTLLFPVLLQSPFKTGWVWFAGWGWGG
jgi:hypothetical protein